MTQNIDKYDESGYTMNIRNETSRKDTDAMNYATEGNTELVNSAARWDDDARAKALGDFKEYNRKAASPGRAWLETVGRPRNFVTPTDCSCEHFQLRLCPLNEELDKRGFGNKAAKCKHFYINGLLELFNPNA